jgi:type III secretion protein V
MVLPVATWMLDALVAINIVFGLLLVLMGIYITSPLQFSAFPSILLISTLYRLALSVATTRMILLNGDAGNIIDAFGGFVAGGNLVVGLVVFLIITIVQFIVIAKGAERVAEVGARFSLDGMPGKQMSIDSDLRSGLIDKDEAKRKRRDLELEAKLHGSMDGAMKFVKGDAIAGIVIIIVNLIGGLAIGVLQLDMDVGDAMAKYSILTVGDGMVAQIPALLGALSAGLIVTRVTDSNDDTNLGESIKSQFSAVPRASLIAGCICFFLAFVPGFPVATFLILGGLLVLAGSLLTPTWKRKIDQFAKPAINTVMPQLRSGHPGGENLHSGDLMLEAVPLCLWLDRQFSEHQTYDDLTEEIRVLQGELQSQLGIVIPTMVVRFADTQEHDWVLHIYEIPAAHGYRETKDALITAADVVAALRRHVSQFVGLQETAAIVSRASANYPDVVRECLRMMPMQSLAAILRNLIAEDVPIRNIRAIFESLVEVAQSEKDINNLTEYVRAALGKQTCNRLAGSGKLSVLLLQPELENLISNSIRVGNGKIELSMDPSDGENLMAVLNAAIKEYQPQAVVTTAPLRRCLRMLVEPSCYDTAVLSHNEVARHVEIEVLGKIGLPQQQQIRSA